MNKPSVTGTRLEGLPAITKIRITSSEFCVATVRLCYWYTIHTHIINIAQTWEVPSLLTSCLRFLAKHFVKILGESSKSWKNFRLWRVQLQWIRCPKNFREILYLKWLSNKRGTGKSSPRVRSTKTIVITKFIVLRARAPSTLADVLCLALPTTVEVI